MIKSRIYLQSEKLLLSLSACRSCVTYEARDVSCLAEAFSSWLKQNAPAAFTAAGLN